jgi:MarR family transcriptional regulator for hemolysin
MKYDFDHSLGKITMQVSKTLGKNLVAKFNKNGIKINAGQWSIISMLYMKKRMTQKDIGNLLGIDKVMIKRIIDQLEIKAIIERKPSESDKRFNYIHLTPSGVKIYLKLRPYAQETLNEAYSGIEESEIRNCSNLLNKIYSNLTNSR